MVRVYNKKTEKEETFGELIKNLKTYFKVHSSSKKYKKTEYYYKKFQ